MPVSDTTALPCVTIDSWNQPFEAAITQQLAVLLPEFIKSRRWFRSKARSISAVTIEDTIPMPETNSCLLVVRVEYADGDPGSDQGDDEYQIPLSVRRGSPAELLPHVDETFAVLKGPDGSEGVLFGALANGDFRNALIDAIACDRNLSGRKGTLAASHTDAFPLRCGAPTDDLHSFVSRAEQSNTSVIYRDRFILKIFRKLEAGINPDIEIGTFLTVHGFKHTPAVLGTLEYRTKSSSYSAAILQEFVPNEGDAWKHTLGSLEGFFKRALSDSNQVSPQLKAYHPMLIMDEPMPDPVRELLGPYVRSAELLGTRTAEMHAALAQPDKTGPESKPHFEPEQFGVNDGQKLYDEMLSQAEVTFGLLRRKEGSLADTAAASGRELVRKESEVTARFSALRESKIDAVKIRYHGDYHLGQVLFTGDDFKIIDFEGEPARPLSERRGKTLAMRDVAGMIRSFEYAAYAALFGQVSGVPTEPESAAAIESWAGFWTAWIGATYLKAYFATAANKPFVPSNRTDRRMLLDAFLLQKALYEVAYELNNRPDWVRIPLHGILKLIA